MIFEETGTFWSPRLTQLDLIITSVADPADLTGKIFTFQNRHNLVNGQLSTSPFSKESILLLEYSLWENDVIPPFSFCVFLKRCNIFSLTSFFFLLKRHNFLIHIFFFCIQLSAWLSARLFARLSTWLSA